MPPEVTAGADKQAIATAVIATTDRPVRIDGLRRTVSDLRRSIDFYCDALGFERSPAGNPRVGPTERLQLGEQHIDLVLASDPDRVAVVVNAPDPRFQHAAIVTDDMQAAWRRLEAHAAQAISRGGPQRLPANTGGVTAFKFRDPDGHPLELIQFPAGSGHPRWQARGADASGPTLGIDHFALVVRAVENSVAFFADKLGFRVAGRSVNRGTEQDRLDGIDGVEVDVVSLEPRRGSGTPHLELLQYRHPGFAAVIDGSPTAFERDEIVCLSERRLQGGPSTLLLCDPDGHRFSVDI